MNNAHGKYISIALCTRNGAAYLYDQLQSIANQSVTPYEIVICDDQSTDQTLDIIKRFTFPDATTVKVRQNDRVLGLKANFHQALGLCTGCYVALCDQDDIWHTNKLDLLVGELTKAERKYGSNLPLLAYTDLRVVDDRGRLIANSFMKYQGLEHVDIEPLKRLLSQNFVTGAAAMVNRVLLENALPLPKEAIYHDWWLALVAAAVGEIVYISPPLVSYRQHADNLLGAKGYYSTANMKKLGRLQQLESRLAGTIMQATALKSRLDGFSKKGAPAYFEDYLSAATSFRRKAFHVAVRNGIGPYGRIRKGVFFSLLLKSGYLKYLDKLDD